MPKTPLTIITGFLGSGKTTLLRHILDTFPQKIAIIMNEFGEINIDGKIIKGKNVEIAELEDGCVCCSLIGEFEAAVAEIISKADPNYIIVETTGIAEPEALIFDVQESLPMVRLDGILTVADADLMVRYPQLGHTTRMQIEDADLLALNKCDLVSQEQLAGIERTLRAINPQAPIIPTQFCQIDTALLFGIARKEKVKPASPFKHQQDYQSLSFNTEALLNPEHFERFLHTLPDTVCRGKGFINFPDGTYLFNFVNGRYSFEPYEKEETALVFIGKNIPKEQFIKELKACEIKPAV